jgi:hypothetical protein
MKFLLPLYLVLAFLAITPFSAQASIRAGCAGTIETGRSDAVGWIDANVMLQLGEAQTPGRFIVTAPDGSVVEHINGAGLTPPNEVMPVWLSPVSGPGEYVLEVDGYECVVEITAGGETNLRAASNGSNAAAPSVNLDDTWQARSALFSN